MGKRARRRRRTHSREGLLPYSGAVSERVKRRLVGDCYLSRPLQHASTTLSTAELLTAIDASGGTSATEDGRLRSRRCSLPAPSKGAASVPAEVNARARRATPLAARSYSPQRAALLVPGGVCAWRRRERRDVSCSRRTVALLSSRLGPERATCRRRCHAVTLRRRESGKEAIFRAVLDDVAMLLTSVFVAQRRVDWGHEDRTDPAGRA